MRYQVAVSPQAERQIRDIVNYISHRLCVSDVASAWLERMEQAVLSLETMPARYALVDEMPWRLRGIRKMPVENFIVYYTVAEEQSAVSVVAVIYGHRNQLSALLSL